MGVEIVPGLFGLSLHHRIDNGFRADVIFAEGISPVVAKRFPQACKGKIP
jgi:hypothetical protein